MLTASSISSIAISRTMRFLRFRKMPTTLIAKSSAATPRYHDSETTPAPSLSFFSSDLLGLARVVLVGHRHQAHTVFPAHPDLARRVLRLRILAPAQRQGDRGDDGDQQDDARDLQREHVLGEGELAQRLDVVDAG